MSDAALRGLARTVFGQRCGIGIAAVGSVDPAILFANEARSVALAVPLRQQEFAAGRAAARQALGLRAAIPVAKDRAPIWPRGWAGSITHAGGWALAVASRGGMLVGVDLEPEAPLPTDILDTVLTPAERARGGADLVAAKRIFVAKEAVYKAQYPVTRALFDFQTLDVMFRGTRFEATFQETITPFRRGESIVGHIASGAGFVLAGVLG